MLSIPGTVMATVLIITIAAILFCYDLFLLLFACLLLLYSPLSETNSPGKTAVLAKGLAEAEWSKG